MPLSFPHFTLGLVEYIRFLLKSILFGKANSMHYLSWFGTGLTDTGLVRTFNQDAFAVENHLGLWVIADGMGGHAGGNVASRLAVDAIVDHVGNALKVQSKNQADEASKFLVEAVLSADVAIHQQVKVSPDLAGMGTTILAVLFSQAPQPALAIAHIGDSRAYRIRHRQIKALTTDHSLVQQLVSQGRITPDQANTHPKQNVLLRALGVSDQSIPDVQVHPLESQDVILLCTDGLTKSISESEILSIILGAWGSPLQTCQQLIARANAQGGKDNITVVLVHPFSSSVE
jgi:serine/threonine protein phosphatase PrpC